MPFDPSVLARWKSVPTSIIADLANGLHQIDPAIKPLRPAGQQPRLFGRAVTAQCEQGDLRAVLQALGSLERGDVLVIAAGGDAEFAMIGDILSGYARRKGSVGLVCDGAVRDVGELALWNDFSVFCRSVTPRGPRTVSRGRANVPVQIGGRTIEPGYLLVGDDDGVTALSADDLVNWIVKAEENLALERQWRERFAKGASVEQVFGGS